MKSAEPVGRVEAADYVHQSMERLDCCYLALHRIWGVRASWRRCRANLASGEDGEWSGSCCRMLVLRRDDTVEGWCAMTAQARFSSSRPIGRGLQTGAIFGLVPET